MPRSFPKPKHPAATGWYQVRWREPLAGSPAVAVQPNASDPTPLLATAVQLSGDNFAVRFRLAGGSAGALWMMQVSAQAQDGSLLVEDVLIGIHD